LRRWLRSLHDELHVTSIFVTHDQEEALEVADRVVLMNRGRVEQDGTPDEVYGQPASPFVYSFLGAVNIFHGRVEGPHIRVGRSTLPHDGSNAIHGADVVGFARPHELEIVTDLSGAEGVDALVRRVLGFGANTRVELDGVEEVKPGAEPRHYEVILPPERVKGLKRGQRVRLVPTPLRVFQREAA
jgi:sulfate transport system ATP-binding protein